MDVAMDKGTINIDNPLVAHYDIPIDQQQIAHFPTVQPFALKLGRSLAIKFDQNLFQLATLAARTAALTGFHNGGNVRQRTAASVDAAYPVTTTGFNNFSQDVSALSRAMDEDDVPEDGRFLFITPQIREVLTHGGLDSSGDTTVFYDRNFGSSPNDLNMRRLTLFHGYHLMVSNHLPTANITTGPSAYQGDFTVGGNTLGTPVAIALCGADEGSAAMGYVAAGDENLNPIKSFIGFDERRNTTFMKAQMMVGAGVLSPWCAGVIQVDSS
jgi:hypothetical protein